MVRLMYIHMRGNWNDDLLSGVLLHHTYPHVGCRLATCQGQTRTSMAVDEDGGDPG